MKKVLAFVLTFVLVASLAVTAFAAPSPVSVGSFKVNAGIASNNTVAPITGAVNGDAVTFTRSSTAGDFTGWKISINGTEAVEGVDYKIVSGSATGNSIEIIPLKDGLTVLETYSSGAAVIGQYITSPATGSTMLIVLGSACMILASVAFVSKKRIAE